MKSNQLFAISPIDGRYGKSTELLANYFSEMALIKYRVLVEVEYFIALHETKIPQLAKFSNRNLEMLRGVYVNFTEGNALEIKKIEERTNHDVKAVEYFLKDVFKENKIDEFQEFIHFGLTSQDINNSAIPLSLKNFTDEQLLPIYENVINLLEKLGKEWGRIPMLAYTHGQPATPTRLGKEIMVFVVRLREQVRQLRLIPFNAKFGGATGNFNAHKVAYPKIDWYKFGKNFVEKKLKLKYSFPTTQIEHYDNLASYFDCIKRINNIIIDLDRDVWMYISMGYFSKQ